MAGVFSLPNEYWSFIQITPQDIESLHNFLFERETPLTAADLSSEFVAARIKTERAAAESKQKSGGKNFLPKEKYQIGDELIFSVFELLSFISQVMTLEPGDVVTTGTPMGVGNLEPGDVVEIQIAGIGTLRNPVVAGLPLPQLRARTA